MKNALALTIFALLFSTLSFSQSHVAMVKKGDLWGYMDNQGNWVIEPQYAKCFHFSDGYAVIYDKIKREHYFINAKNERVLDKEGPYLVKAGGYFSDGMAIIMKKKLLGSLNTSGDLVIPVEYNKLDAFYEGKAIGKAGKSFYILDKAGKKTLVEDAIDLKHFSEGLAPFRAKNKLFGFVNANGEVKIEPTFKSVGYFSSGLAWAKTMNDKVGYIDQTGNWVIAANYIAAKPFGKQAKFARVKEIETWFFIDSKGAKINMPDAINFGNFCEGLVRVKIGTSWGFANQKGEMVIPAKFQGVKDFKNGYASAKTGDLWGIIDTSGNWVIQPEYRGIGNMYPLSH